MGLHNHHHLHRTGIRILLHRHREVCLMRIKLIHHHREVTPMLLLRLPTNTTADPNRIRTLGHLRRCHRRRQSPPWSKRSI